MTMTTLKDTVYQQTIEMICNGTIQAGDIITEKQLIAHFGISKSPVREALIQLCHDNVLKSIPRCGYQVVQINAKNIHDLTEIRMCLELFCLTRLIAHPSADFIAHLRDLNQQRANPSEEKTMWTAWNNNVNFHLALAEEIGNSYVLEYMKNTLAICTRAYAQLFCLQKESIIPSTPKNHVHDRITDAIEKQDLENARALLSADILQMEKNLLAP